MLGAISARTLVIARPFGESRRLTWFSSDGGPGSTVSEAGNLTDIQLSPDQRHLVFARSDSATDIWLADAARGGAHARYFNEGVASAPVFSPDGARIAYTSDTASGFSLMVRSSLGAGAPEKVFQSKIHVQCSSWSPDGRWLGCILGGPGRWNIYLIPVAGGKPVQLFTTGFDEYQPQFSPNGRWLAYTSNETGAYEM